MKSVKLEWCLGDIPKAKELLAEAVKHYPGFPKVVFANMMRSNHSVFSFNDCRLSSLSINMFDVIGVVDIVIYILFS